MTPWAVSLVTTLSITRLMAAATWATFSGLFRPWRMKLPTMASRSSTSLDERPMVARSRLSRPISPRVPSLSADSAARLKAAISSPIRGMRRGFGPERFRLPAQVGDLILGFRKLVGDRPDILARGPAQLAQGCVASDRGRTEGVEVESRSSALSRKSTASASFSCARPAAPPAGRSRAGSSATLASRKAASRPCILAALGPGAPPRGARRSARPPWSSR